MDKELDLIKNLSRDISWAVFRCLALFGNEKLKDEIGSVAVDLVTTYNSFRFEKNSSEEIAEQLQYIDKIKNLLKLAESLKEINQVNSAVLYRELGNLRNLVTAYVDSRKSSAGDKEKDLIGEMFVKYRQPTTNNQQQEEKIQNTEYRMLNIEERGMGAETRLPKKEVEQFSEKPRPIAEFIKPENILANIGNGGSAGNLEMSSGKRIAETNSVPNRPWQDLIFKKVLEKGQISTRELMVYFPEISERTIRLYLQRLTEAGMVEKIGTTGPGSYYQLPRR